MQSFKEFITESSDYEEAYKNQHNALIGTVKDAATKSIGADKFTVKDDYDSMGLVYIKPTGKANTKELMATRNEIAKSFPQYVVSVEKGQVEIDIT